MNTVLLGCNTFSRCSNVLHIFVRVPFQLLQLLNRQWKILQMMCVVFAELSTYLSPFLRHMMGCRVNFGTENILSRRVDTKAGAWSVPYASGYSHQCLADSYFFLVGAAANYVQEKTPAGMTVNQNLLAG